MGLTSRPQQPQSWRVSQLQAVERAEAYMRAHLSSPVSLSKLCHIVGLSERSLRNAFYVVRGMGPKRCMLVERLEGVRRELTSGARPCSVTRIAAYYGFYELGRFAGTYKQMYGEVPSATLRRQRSKMAAELHIERERP